MNIKPQAKARPSRINMDHNLGGDQEEPDILLSKTASSIRSNLTVLWLVIPIMEGSYPHINPPHQPRMTPLESH